MPSLNRFIIELAVVAALIAALFVAAHTPLAGTGEEGVQEVTAIVLATDNSDIMHSAAGAVGPQRLEAMIDGGALKGTKTPALNHLNGQMDMDELFVPGDRILLAIRVADGTVSEARTINTFRQNWELALFAVFALALVAYARLTGLKALVSFMASLGVLWYFYIPNLLNGAAPLPLSLAVLVLLSLVIIITVAGFTRQGIAAFLGTVSGMAVTLLLTLLFGEGFRLSGMTTPFSTTLLVQGAYGLNFQHIFYSAVLLGASGAAMDIAMDVSASMHEIKVKRPDIGMKELVESGFNIGRMVIGTMSTTLLLAYSGGYLTMLMVFVSQETSIARILNMKLVAAEVFRVLIGSIGLLLVAPVTAIIAGALLTFDFSRLRTGMPYRIGSTDRITGATGITGVTNEQETVVAPAADK
ncbi:YibE/F family protein [Desulfovibrio subterraneus]|uniref:Membrane protein n=1 Tax=Desulfovibrio subterraneus TaxID=2718620 RepID=A0A7J0BG25_9BACT|nr:YibE/F family protein [Desulfovibrio subterraneus]GFM32650.1 membrane protein [Desulfovibrio subterraneus]